MDEGAEVPEQVHDQPAEGGREQVDEALERQEHGGRRAPVECDAPPRAGLESEPVDEAAARPGDAGQ